MPGASTVVNKPVRGPPAGTQARMAPDVAMPRAPPTASTPATTTAHAGLAKTARAATVVGPATKTSSVAVASSA
jgi:hypothetical protein